MMNSGSERQRGLESEAAFSGIFLSEVELGCINLVPVEMED